MRNRQRGITFIGWLVLLLPVAVVGYAVIRTVPVYLNYMKVNKALQQLAAENVGEEQITAAALHNSLEKHFEIDSITFPPLQSIAFTREGKGMMARAKYEDEVPLFGNLSLLIKFDKSVKLK